MIWELRHEFKIWLLIDIAKIPRSTYYYYSKQFDSPKPDKYAEIKSEIRRIYDESKGRYGYRRITKELKKKYVINHKTVQKLMRKMGIFCRVRMRKYNSYKGSVGKIAPNLLERDFKADKPNQKWVTDVTEFALFGIKLYLSPIIDLFNGEVVSYNLSRHPNLAQTTDMLNKAFAKIPDNTNLILHSDQGWQYQHKHYQQMLADKGIRQSMSRKGNCLDNVRHISRITTIFLIHHREYEYPFFRIPIYISSQTYSYERRNILTIHLLRAISVLLLFSF